jgi:hypothetical protein
MKTYSGSGGIDPRILWPRQYVEVSGQLHALAALPPGKEPPGTCGIGDLVGLRAGLHTYRRKNPPSRRDSSSDHPARSHSLYRLSYPVLEKYVRLENQSSVGRIIFNLTLKEEDGLVWKVLIWLRVGSSGGLLWKHNWIFRSYKRLGISWLADRLLTSEEGPCSMELLSYIMDQYIDYL